MIELPRHQAFLPYPDHPVPSAPAGPLAGMTLAVKDIFDLVGYPTGAGNAYVLAQSGVKTVTAPIIQALLDAGASFAGKSYTDELAYSLLGQNVHFGSSANPAFPGLITGGSSSGSAVAVAAGLAKIGLGTDTSGSIRVPAALTGTIGWRPTHAVLSLVGCRPLAPSFDTPGFIVNDLDVLKNVMDALGIPACADPKPPVLAQDMLDAVDAEVLAQFLDALQASGRHFESARPLADFALPELAETFQTILRHEAWQTNATLLDERPDAIDPAIRQRLAEGREISEARLDAAHDLQRRLAAHMESWLAAGVILAFPTLPSIPPDFPAIAPADTQFRQRLIALTCIAGLAGLPQLTIPLGRTSPTQAISLLAGRGRDRALLVAARNLNGAR